MNLKLILAEFKGKTLAIVSAFLKAKLIIPFALFFFLNIETAFGANETIPTGSYIIDMGVSPQTVSNGLKPYGLIYALIKDYKVPIKWVINPTKGKDGIDFTYNGYDYKSGPFIITADFRTPAVNALISTWEAKGVIGKTTTSPVTVFVYTTINYFMTWTLDAQNGKIAEAFLQAAEMPISSYQFKEPSLLDCCNDLYVMPHADPTWDTHKNLLYWNNSSANGGCTGAIYASCHAVSVWENTYNPANPTERMNFLMKNPISPSTESAVPFGSHTDGSPPYSYDFHTHPVMQFLGNIDAATQNGSEQIFLPRANGWRPETKIGVWDPSQSDIPALSPGKAAVIAFGPGKGDTMRGRVMYEGAHNIGKSNNAENVAAQRAFFNFAYWASEIKAIQLVPNIPTNMVSTEPYNVSVGATGGAGGYVYKWSSTCNGTFANPNAATTTFTPASVADTTNCIVSCVVTDVCGSRTTFVSIKVEVAPKLVCQDITDAGQIGIDQSNCGTFDPSTFTNITSPTGGSGTLEYQWYSNNSLLPANDASWIVISGTNADSYNPPTAVSSIYYIRKARRSGCTVFEKISNISRVTVNTGCSPCLCQRQLLHNTDFENGTANGWMTGIVGQAGTASVYIYSGGPTGKYAALNYTDANSTTGDYYIEQKWNSIIPGRTYIFSGDLARHAGTRAFIRAEFYNASNQLLSQTPDQYATTQYPTFIPFSFNLVAPPGASYIRIVGFANRTALKMDNVKLVTCFEPVISFVNLMDANTCSGGSVSFNAILSDPSVIVNYQWQSSPNGTTWTNVSGATSATFTVSPTVNTFYRVNATPTNGSCSTTSSYPLKVTIHADPTVAVIAGNASICTGSSTTLTATVSNGTGTTNYQWQSSSDDVTFSNILGETNAVLNLNNLTATAYYKVNITQAGNGCGIASSTTSTKITVKAAPSVSVATSGAEICSGGASSLTATVINGSDSTTYQWQSSSDDVTFSNISGETNAVLNLNNLTATTYYKVNITQAGSGCGTASSTTSTKITVNPAPSVSVATSGAEICSGGASSLTTTVINGSGSTTYQWQSSTDDVTFSNISGEINAVLNLNNLTATTYYKVNIAQLGNGCGTASSTTSTKITVKAAPSVNVAASNAEICSGGSSSLTATVINGSGSTTYQWQSSSDNVTFNNISGETNATLNLNNLTATTYYKVTISQAGNGCGTASSTTSTKITVKAAPSVSVATSGAEICSGGASSLTATVINGSGSTTYQWQSSSDNVTFNNISGETNATLNLNNLTATTYYKVTISQAGSGCGTASSTTSTKITVKAAPSVNVSASNAEICSGGASTLTATVINGSGSTTYQWQSSTDDVTFSNVSGETNATLSLINLTATTYYKVNIAQAGSGCNTASSTTSTKITVKAAPSVNVAASNAEICSGGASTLTATVINGSGSTTYQWQSSTDDVTFSNISGETNAVLNLNNLTATTYYKVNISQAGSGCGTASSTTSTKITVKAAPSVNVAASNAEICSGGASTLTATVSNGSGTISFQWQNSTDGISFNNIAGETAASLTTPVLTQTTYYRVVVSQSGNGCGTVNSAATAINVAALPTADAGADQSQCNNVFNMAANNPSAGTGTWTIINGTATIANINSPTTTVTVTSSTAIFRWMVRVNATCEEFDDVLLNLAQQLLISSDPTAIDECIEGNRAMGVNISGGTGFQNYQWQSSTDNITWLDVKDATNSSFIPQSLTAGTTYYRVIITPVGAGCNVVTSGSARVRIFEKATITVVANDATVCAGNGTTFSATVSNGVGTIIYQWQNSTDGINFSNIGGATNVTYNTPALTETMHYRLQITQSGSGCGIITSTSTTVTVVSDPVANAGADKTQCSNIFKMTANTPSKGTGLWTVINGTATIDDAQSPTTNVTITSPTATLRWTNKVNNTCSNADEVMLSIAQPLSISAQPNDITQCVGGSLTLTAAVTGGAGTLTYQWQSSSDNTAWSDISGANDIVYTPSSTTSGVVYYRLMVRSSASGCSEISTNSATVTIIDKPKVAVTAKSTTVCNGGGIQLDATINGGVDCTVQWQNSINGGAAWNDIPGATSNTFTTSILGQTTKYRVTLSCNGNGCCN